MTQRGLSLYNLTLFFSDFRLVFNVQEVLDLYWKLDGGILTHMDKIMSLAIGLWSQRRAA